MLTLSDINLVSRKEECVLLEGKILFVGDEPVFVDCEPGFVGRESVFVGHEQKKSLRKTTKNTRGKNIFSSSKIFPPWGNKKGAFNMTPDT